VIYCKTCLLYLCKMGSCEALNVALDAELFEFPMIVIVLAEPEVVGNVFPVVVFVIWFPSDIFCEVEDSYWVSDACSDSALTSVDDPSLYTISGCDYAGDGNELV